MKPSEIRLLEMINRNNHMRIDSTRVSFGTPRVSPDRRHNTWIEIIASPDDPQYDRSTTTQYNRLDARTLGVGSVIDVFTTDLAHANDAVLETLLSAYNIPCSESELLPRSRVVLTEALAVLTFDFDNHPLIYGSISVRLHVNAGDLSTVITTTALSGFTLEDIGEPNLTDEITITHLSGFTPSDVS